MRTPHNASVRSNRPTLEPLESRQFLSAALPLAAAPSASNVPSTTATTVVLAGTSIYAQTTQSFRAVLGTIRNLPTLPTGYSLQGSINWGDNKSASPATFVRQADGSLAVLGSHTYTTPTTSSSGDPITITVTAAPPAGSLAAIRLIGTIHSTAKIFAPDGGVTLSETAKVPFTANLGTFRSKLSSTTMTATIDWGDGTQSTGKILALPTADPLAGGAFSVTGAHTYKSTASYLVHITVTSRPFPTTTAAPTPPLIILVAQFDSVIDVLPPLPSAAT